MRARNNERDEFDSHNKTSSSISKDFGLIRILCFPIVFVIGIVIGLASSSHVDRYFTSQPYSFKQDHPSPNPNPNPNFTYTNSITKTTTEKDDKNCTTTTNVVISCIKEDCLSMKSFRAPKNLSHGMTDEELFWRASMVPEKAHYPFDRMPKIAFMFLTRGPLPLLPLWERFFKGQDKRKYSVYVHTNPDFKLNVTNSSAFHDRQVPSKGIDPMADNPFSHYPQLLTETQPYYLIMLSGCDAQNAWNRTLCRWDIPSLHSHEPQPLGHDPCGCYSPFIVTKRAVKWGTVSLVDAERRLLANALLDFSNERFVLLSESCIPIYNFPTVYKYLVGSIYSYLDSYDDPSRYGRGRYNRRMKPDIRLRDWRKGSQWFEMKRALAIKVIADTKYYRLFKKYCTPDCYPDEHYMATFAHMFHESLNADRTVTYVDWSLGGPHPASFDDKNISESFMGSLRNNGTTCLYNKGTTSVCYLFARKFNPSALEPLLKLAEEVFGY
ncbi:hypothetical protein OSB04_011911 [Centaurea solstitialis]|uniref:Core-2/I-branching beta-1,6-N-acetylglucosaminyltransferase family protein n=1 Tax=Centaurea solstitialis TaxID=347529 RepID=A0AA38WE45_9ASTR|nr:hypothetical protein OSB04_011911 [Centaurea solstitialis]